MLIDLTAFPEIKPKAAQALNHWAAFEKSARKKTDATPHQMAKWAGCDPKTIYRALPAMLEAGLVEVTQPGNPARRKAVLLVLGSAWPQMSHSRTLKGPTGSTPYRPPANYSASAPTSKSQEGRCAGFEKKKEKLKGCEASLAAKLAGYGVSMGGVQKALKVSRDDERTAQALRDLSAVDRFLKSKPDWLKEGQIPGLVFKVVTDPVRALKLKRQARYHAIQAKRAGKKAKKATILAGASMPKATYQEALAVWQACKAVMPKPEAPGYLDAQCHERRAFEAFIQAALEHLGEEGRAMEAQLNADLDGAGLQGLARDRAFKHHMGLRVMERLAITCTKIV